MSQPALRWKRKEEEKRGEERRETVLSKDNGGKE
jgi:hypothetical protein